MFANVNAVEATTSPPIESKARVPPAAGGVDVRTVFELAVVERVVDAAEAGARPAEALLAGVVVHDVEDHLETGLVQQLDHAFELGEHGLGPAAAGGLGRVGGVRGEEVEGVVSPVVGQAALEQPARAEQAFDVSGRLALAAQAIAHAKQQFDHGAGNQLEAQWVSLGNAGQRADATKGLNPIARAELPSEHAQAVANDVTAVGIGRGGTCRQYAAIVYAFLVGKVPGVSMVSAAGDHVFVVIGDLAREADQTLVAADAWPSVAQAMRLSEHFSGGKAKVKPTLVDRELPGGQVKPAAQLEERLTAVPDPSVGALLGQSGLELAPTGARSLGLVRYQVDDGRGRMRPAASSLHVDQDAPLGGSAAPRSPDRAPSSVGPSDRDLAPSGPASRRAPPASSGGLKQAITELGAAWEEHDDDERLVAAVLELSIGSADVELVLELADGLRQRRLGYVARRRRAGEVSFPRQRHEIFKLTELHNSFYHQRSVPPIDSAAMSLGQVQC